MIELRNNDPIDLYARGLRVSSVYAYGEKVWSNHEEIPYIVSNGNSWADTGLYLDPTIHRVQGSFIVDDLSMISFQGIYVMEGARTSSSSGVTKVNTHIRKLSESTYEVRRDWGVLSNMGQYDGVIYEVGKEYTFDYTPEYTEINGLRIERTAESDGLCKHSYFIGKSNDPIGIPTSYVPPGVRATKRIFSVYTTGEVIGESVPVFRKYDSTFQIYDTVTKEFLENKGSESWSGAFESWVYDMGRPLNYLEKVGNLPYIDLGTLLTEKSKVTIDFSGLKTGCLFGARETSSSKAFYINAATSLSATIRVGNNLKVISLEDDNYTLVVDKTGIVVNGLEDPFTSPSTSFSTPVNSYLFNLNNNGSTFVFPNDYTKIKKLIIEEDGNTVLNLIPFLTWEGVKGYLNLINRELLLNQGTGEFQAPTIPVYALNWKDEEFDPIAGKVSTIGDTGFTTGLGWNDWTEGQKQVFRGKKLKISWKLSAKDVVGAALNTVGFSTKIQYKDESLYTVRAFESLSNIFTGLESPYTLVDDYSYSTVIQIEDKEIGDIINYQPQFYLTKVQSGELKAYDIKWEVDVPEYEIDAIEGLELLGVDAFADFIDNRNELSKLGIE